MLRLMWLDVFEGWLSTVLKADSQTYSKAGYQMYSKADSQMSHSKAGSQSGSL